MKKDGHKKRIQNRTKERKRVVIVRCHLILLIDVLVWLSFILAQMPS
jgi:hypothetical protein